MTPRSVRSTMLRILWRLWGVDMTMPRAKCGGKPDLFARAAFRPIRCRNGPQGQQPGDA